MSRLRDVARRRVSVLLNDRAAPAILPNASFFLGVPCNGNHGVVSTNLNVTMTDSCGPNSAPSNSVGFIISLTYVGVHLRPGRTLGTTALGNTCTVNRDRGCKDVTGNGITGFFVAAPLPSISFVPCTCAAPVIGGIILKKGRF